jgi:hypothetical protein
MNLLVLKDPDGFLTILCQYYLIPGSFDQLRQQVAIGIDIVNNKDLQVGHGGMLMAIKIEIFD